MLSEYSAVFDCQKQMFSVDQIRLLFSVGHSKTLTTEIQTLFKYALFTLVKLRYSVVVCSFSTIYCRILQENVQTQRQRRRQWARSSEARQEGRRWRKEGAQEQ